MRDEWIIGESLDGARTFVLHLAAPRFVAEVFDGDDEEAILAPFSVALANGQQLANFVLFDGGHFNGELRRCALLASEALDVYDLRLGSDNRLREIEDKYDNNEE